MSSLDIPAGSRWFDELMEQLKQTEFCVSCLTHVGLARPDGRNQNAG